MIFINEWLPNPSGADTGGEFVELFNNDQAAMDLGDWVLRTGGKSKFNLHGNISAGGYLVLQRSETKLALKNVDEKIFLYDAGGNLVDKSGFLGSAPEGKSFSRISYTSNAAQNFVWSDPTPGSQNKISFDSSIIRNTYPSGVPLNKTLGPLGFWSLLFSSSIILTLIIIFIFKRNENLSKLFFGRD